MIEKISLEELKITAANFSYYTNFINTSIDKLAFIKDLKNKKNTDALILFMISTEENEHKLSIIFANYELENKVTGYLENIKTPANDNALSLYIKKITRLSKNIGILAWN